MKVIVGEGIFKEQNVGGISRIWNKISPRIVAQLRDRIWMKNRPDMTFFLPTYYEQPLDDAIVITTVYDFIAERCPHITDAWLERRKQRSIRAAHEVVAISKWTQGDVKLWTGREAAVAYLGTDFTRQPLGRVALYLKQMRIDRPYFLFVGRRRLYKNARAGIDAILRFDATGRYLIVLVGGEPLDEQEARLAAEGRLLRLSVDDRGLQLLYSGAQALVYPSLYEGFGLPVVEAQACGCPVVCGDGGALAETAAARVHCDPLREDSIVEALHVVADKDARREYVERGIVAARSFTWDACARVYADIIERIYHE